MKLVTREQMKKIDEAAINNYRIPGILLMEHAAYAVFQHMKEQGLLQNVVILCGAGNNGGDGFALARQLYVWGKGKITILFMSEEAHLTEDAKTYYSICRSMSIPMLTYTNNGVGEVLENAQVIVDALFGTGLSREITGKYYEVIEKVNKSQTKVISIDIPSGIDADTGKVLGIAIKADATITFELPKIGQYIYPGIDHIGELYVVPIGIPRQVLEERRGQTWTIDEPYAKTLLPLRKTRSNKGTYGKVLLIGGKRGMSGAITLASMSCQRSGAGIVTAAVPKSIHDIMEQKVTEVMTIPLEDEQGHIGVKAIEQIEKLLPGYDIIGIGPGIGRSSAIGEIIKHLLKSEKPCVVDADGLYALKPYLKEVKDREAPVLITPHPGEMANLIDEKISTILDNPLEITKKFAITYGITTVLKLERTIISDTQGRLYINTTGNPGLAKGGSGDVLTGIITSFLAQGLLPEEAAHLGVYMHGRVADYLADKESMYTLLPSHLIDHLHIVFKELQN